MSLGRGKSFGEVDVIDEVDANDDDPHLVVSEWVSGKQLWLLSSIRPDQYRHCGWW